MKTDLVIVQLEIAPESYFSKGLKTNPTAEVYIKREQMNFRAFVIKTKK
jgi:hypothetical protein